MMIVVCAGANGSGKSSLYSVLNKDLDLLFINPDTISKDFFSHITNEEERYRKYAMPLAEEWRKTYLENKKDFSFETVLSHESKLEFLSGAKKQGYDIYSIFMGTDDPSINIDRVTNRVLNGGHDVPLKKIVDRYYRTMSNLPKLLNISKEAVVLDNSADKPIEVFYKINNNYYLLNGGVIPKWVDRYIIDPLKNDGYIREQPKCFPSENINDSLAGITKYGLSEWKSKIIEMKEYEDQTPKTIKRNKDEHTR